LVAYLVVVCYRCGKALVAKASFTTRLCPYCGMRIVLGKARKVAFSSSASEASEKLRVFNERKKD
jgi:DNA-directed RNA polymerase subunit RPC12/RpoP